jgi:hypothetical protein
MSLVTRYNKGVLGVLRHRHWPGISLRVSRLEGSLLYSYEHNSVIHFSITGDSTLTFSFFRLGYSSGIQPRVREDILRGK